MYFSITDIDIGMLRIIVVAVVSLLCMVNRADSSFNPSAYSLQSNRELFVNRRGDIYVNGERIKTSTFNRYELAGKIVVFGSKNSLLPVNSAVNVEFIHGYFITIPARVRVTLKQVRFWEFTLLLSTYSGEHDITVDIGDGVSISKTISKTVFLEFTIKEDVATGQKYLIYKQDKHRLHSPVVEIRSFLGIFRPLIEQAQSSEYGILREVLPYTIIKPNASAVKPK